MNDEERKWTESQPFGDPSKTSLLTACKMLADDTQQVRELIRSGNRKPVYSLNPTHDIDRPTPELSSIRLLVRYMATQAYVDFGDGRPAQGTEDLTMTMQMVNRIPQDSMARRMSAVANTSILLAEFESHLGALSAKDVAQAQSMLKSLPDWEGKLFEAANGTIAGYKGIFAKLREAPKPEDIAGLVYTEWLPFFQTMSSAQRQGFVDAAADRVETDLGAEVEIYKLPESRWFAEFKLQVGSDSREQDISKPPATPEEGVVTFSKVMTYTFRQYASSEAKFRTQVRLLRLHLRILAYRWSEGKLPDLLQQAAPPEEIRDSFGSGEFQYQPDGYGNYQLFSKGFPGLGRLDLRYRRDPNAPVTDPNDIPPR